MSTTISAPLQVAREGGVLTLTLHRPDKLNSLDISLLKALAEAITEAREDETVRAVVITGSGRGFSAGADLTEGGRGTCAAASASATRRSFGRCGRWRSRSSPP
jgi:enoyl-CoA hydratase/carnithine racemase